MVRCIAIDDEPLALRQIARYIQRLPETQLVGTFYSTEAAQETIDNKDIDVVFLDIEMPDCNGVEFAQTLGPKPHVIFTTAYPQYAVEGFRLDAVDYLLKPLNFEELTKAMEKVKRRMSQMKLPQELDHPAIFVKADGRVQKIIIDDILYVKGLGEYVQIYLKKKSTPIVTFISIKKLEKELFNYNFRRVHKSFLINLQAISEASRTSVVINGQTIPVGEKYRTDFSRYLKSKLNPESIENSENDQLNS